MIVYYNIMEVEFIKKYNIKWSKVRIQRYIFEVMMSLA